MIRVGGQDVDVVEFGKLLRREGFGGTEGHMACIVDDDVETAGIRDDFSDPFLDGGIGGDVKFDGAQIDTVLSGKRCRIGDGFGIAGSGGAHAGINRMAFCCERPGGHGTEAAGSAGDDDDVLAHGPVPSEK